MLPRGILSHARILPHRKVVIKTQVQNDTTEAGEVTVKTVLVGPSGTKSRELKGTVQLLRPANRNNVETTRSTTLWSPESPHLYAQYTGQERRGPRPG